jgi:homoserine O-acetyltransferase
MAPTSWPNQSERIVLIEDFLFASGERLSEMRQNVITFGTPVRNAAGQIQNAVLLLHNTTGNAATWLLPELADELFAPGRPLDAGKYFLVAGDMIGFNKSSKPSDGLRARFPHYRYADMVAAQHRVLTEHLDILHVRLVLGLSMGGMLTWMFGELFPDFMDALVPIASQPGPMSGRNWIQRRINIEAIRSDPEWENGDYKRNPSRWVLTAPIGALMTQSVTRIQEMAPTRTAADALYRHFVERAKMGDANDRLYQLESSMDYDPSNALDKIKARLLAINFADDELNPHELGVLEPAIAKIPGACCVLLPAGPLTQGHYSTMRAALWQKHLAGFLAELR